MFLEKNVCLDCFIDTMMDLDLRKFLNCIEEYIPDGLYCDDSDEMDSDETTISDEENSNSYV